MASNCAQWSLVWLVVTVCEKSPAKVSHVNGKQTQRVCKCRQIRNKQLWSTEASFPSLWSQMGSNWDTRIRRTSDLSSSGEIIHRLKTQPKLEPAAEHKLYPTLFSQPQETCFYLYSQQQNKDITLNKYTNSENMRSKNSIWTYQAVEIISREDYLSQFKLMNQKQILGNMQDRVRNKK